MFRRNCKSLAPMQPDPPARYTACTLWCGVISVLAIKSIRCHCLWPVYLHSNTPLHTHSHTVCLNGIAGQARLVCQTHTPTPHNASLVLGVVVAVNRPAAMNVLPGPARNRSVFRQMCQIPCAAALDMYFKPNARYMMQRQRRRHYCFWPKAVVARRRRGATPILGGTVNQIFDRT